MSEPRPRYSNVRAALRLRHLWFAALVAAIGYLVLTPVAVILWSSLRDASPGDEPAFSLRNYAEVFASPTFGRSFLNTLIFAGGAAVISFGLGTYLAWVTERTNAPFRRVIYTLVLLPLVVPGILTTVAWSLILHPKIGILPFVDGQSMLGMIWVRGVDGITLPFLLSAVALRAMDPAMEEAAEVSGSKPSQMMRWVTAPLMTPALLAAALLVVVTSLDTFEVPALLGLPGGVRVLATEVFLAARQFPFDTNLAAAYAVVTLALSILGIWLYYRATSLSDRFETITAGGHRAARRDLGRRRHLHTGAALVIVGVCVIAPLLVVAYTSLVPYYSPPSRAAWATMSLGNYRHVLFESSLFDRALLNNVVGGAMAAGLVVVLGAAISWTVLRTRVPGRRLLDALSFSPIAFPGLVLGLALLLLYLALPIPVYGTMWIIGIGWVTAFLPFGLRIVHAALAQLRAELEEASATSGAGGIRTITRIVIPLVAPGLLVAFLFVYSLTFRVLSLPLLLAGPGTSVLPMLIYDLNEAGRQPELNALGMLMVIFLVGVAAVIALLNRRMAR